MSEPFIPTKPGIYHNIPFENYKRIPAINSSRLKRATRSMAHVLSALDEPDKETTAKAFGRLVHTITLQPELLSEVIPPPLNTTGKYKDNPKPYGAETKAYAEFVEANPGKIVAAQEDIDHCVKIIEKVSAHPIAGPIIDFARTQRGKPNRLTELTLVWERHGVLCKARVDIAKSGDCWADIKTCDDARPEAFARSVETYAYDIQYAMYRDGLSALGSVPLPFRWIAIETNGSHELMVHEPSDDWKAIAIASYELAIKQYADCVKSGKWPGYSRALSVIDIPKWRENALLGIGA